MCISIPNLVCKAQIKMTTEPSAAHHRDFFVDGRSAEAHQVTSSWTIPRLPHDDEGMTTTTARASPVASSSFDRRSRSDGHSNNNTMPPLARRMDEFAVPKHPSVGYHPTTSPVVSDIIVDRMPKEECDNQNHRCVDKKKSSKEKSQQKFQGGPRPKPKRPLSAYNLFFRHERARIVGEDADGDGGDASSSSSDDEPLPFLTQSSSSLGPADDLLNTFPEACLSFAAVPPPPTSAGKKTRHRKANKSKKSKHSKKKRVPHGKISFSELASVVSKKWRTIDAHSRAKFEALAQVERRRYEHELQVWNAERVAEAERQIAEQERKEEEEAAAGGRPKERTKMDPVFEGEVSSSPNFVAAPAQTYATAASFHRSYNTVAPRAEVVSSLSPPLSRAAALPPGQRKRHSDSDCLYAYDSDREHNNARGLKRTLSYNSLTQPLSHFGPDRKRVALHPVGAAADVELDAESVSFLLSVFRDDNVEAFDAVTTVRGTEQEQEFHLQDFM
eukprot:CAMPEP_0197434838 /NCGR_PEP_ID=MMETSP1175-20131217/2513_1 /TAXON_ID=1003142 /ORGANISM="Triceratium dubium, Strain CCMP147" /LENGTH=500 /DNA_ID=CAMNT_0042963693 /DNA_START=200 /DNA_END=1702 /DNA_ORIENTATION=-